MRAIVERAETEASAAVKEPPTPSDVQKVGAGEEEKEKDDL